MRLRTLAVGAALVAAMLVCSAPLRAYDVNPWSKVVAAQQRDNQQWLSEAQNVQRRLMDLATQMEKQELFDKAADYYRQAMSVYYVQWKIRSGVRVLHDERESSTLDLPATRKIRVLLVTSTNEAAGKKLEALSDKQQSAVVDSAFKQAQALEKEKKYAEAYALYEKLATANLSSQLQKRYQKRSADSAAKIVRAADKALDAVVAAAADEKTMAKVPDMIEDFLDQYGGLENVPELRGKYLGLAQNPDVAKVRREAQAADQLEAAKALMGDNDLVNGYELLRRVDDLYYDTAAGKEAGQELAKIRANKLLYRRIMDLRAEKDCATKMMMARNWAANDRIERAVAIYKDILATYPDSTYAEEAAKALAALQAKKPAGK